MKNFQIFDKFNTIKEIKDLIDEKNKLDDYFQKKDFASFDNHVINLMLKYAEETFKWNSLNRDMPQTYEQKYNNAVNFLYSLGIEKLLKKGIKIQK